VFFCLKNHAKKNIRKLIAWKSKPNRMPFIVNGARQVGKSYILRGFGKAAFNDFIIVNLETDKALAEKFAQSMIPQNIIQYLETVHNHRIIAGKTLIIFDEIQAFEPALTSLKYFCEQAPQYHVIAAGSLLG